MLSPEELDDIRAVGGDALEGVCVITRKQQVRNPNGSWTDQQVPVYTDIRCRKVPTGQTPFERITLNGVETSMGVATFIVGSDLAIYKDDVFVYNGHEYGVMGTYYRDGAPYVRVVVYDDSGEPQE